MRVLSLCMRRRASKFQRIFANQLPCVCVRVLTLKCEPWRRIYVSNNNKLISRHVLSRSTRKSQLQSVVLLINWIGACVLTGHSSIECRQINVQLNINASYYDSRYVRSRHEIWEDSSSSMHTLISLNLALTSCASNASAVQKIPFNSKLVMFCRI